MSDEVTLPVELIRMLLVDSIMLAKVAGSSEALEEIISTHLVTECEVAEDYEKLLAHADILRLLYKLP